MVNNHQEKNARVLEHAGAARVLLESDATPETLYENLRDLLSDRERLSEMARNMRALAVDDATEKITALALELAGR